MEDASVITSLPDDPQALKQIILSLSRERDDWHVKFLRIETELLRLRKWYYGPSADRLQTPGDVAQLLLQFATGLEARPVNLEDVPAGEPLPDVGTVQCSSRSSKPGGLRSPAGGPQGTRSPRSGKGLSLLR